VLDNSELKSLAFVKVNLWRSLKVEGLAREAYNQWTTSKNKINLLNLASLRHIGSMTFGFPVAPALTELGSLWRRASKILNLGG